MDEITILSKQSALLNVKIYINKELSKLEDELLKIRAEKAKDEAS